MDLNWLRDFICLGRTLNFTKAAQERNITQSAFSRRIKSLENWLGVPLIDRATYPVRLSEAGEQFLVAAKENVAQLTEMRQYIRQQESSRTSFQRFAVLHTISVNYLVHRIAEFEKTMTNLRARTISDSLASCCQLLSEGACEFLLVYRHKDVEPQIDEKLFARKDIAKERLIPVAERDAAARNGWALTAFHDQPVPYLSYDPSTFLGTVVDHTINYTKLPLDIRYIDGLVEALKRRALAGGGVAWLPEFSIESELSSGKLIPIGPPKFEAVLTLSLYCSPSKLDETGLEVWERF